MMTKTRTGEALLAFADAYAATRGFQFGDGARSAFEAAMERGGTLIEDLPPNDRDARTEEIRANAGRVIDAMVDYSRTHPDYAQRHKGVIGEQTYGHALSLLCPIFPFC